MGTNTITGWTINWGDGTGNQTITGNPSSVQYTFAIGVSSADITATATDQAGAHAADAPVAVSLVPAVPGNVTAQWSSDGSVLLSWTEQSAFAPSFVVGESTDGGGSFTTLATVAAGNTSYTVTNPPSGAIFNVATTNGPGNSSTATQAVNPSQPMLTVAGVSGSDIYLSFSDPAPDGSNLELEEIGPNDANFHVIPIPDESNGVYPVNDLNFNASYGFLLRADLNGAVYSTEADATTNGGNDTSLSAVQNLQANPTDQTISFNMPSASPSGLTLVGYEINGRSPQCNEYGWGEVNFIYTGNSLAPGKRWLSTRVSPSFSGRKCNLACNCNTLMARRTLFSPLRR